MFFYSLNTSFMYVYYLFHVCCIFYGAIKNKIKKQEKNIYNKLWQEFTIAKSVRYITYGKWLYDNSEYIGQTLQPVVQ